MSETVDNLILDLLEWIGPGQRPYAETLEAWRTSCPRLPVWEEANERGFIAQLHAPGQAARVAVSPLGRAQLAARRAQATGASRVPSSTATG
jgi:D-3-phosphoglycerate dehydrogenase